MQMINTKMIESIKSILPIVLIVFLFSLTPLIKLTRLETTVFLISAVGLIIGMALFNLGAELSMTPMGDNVGAGLIKTKKLSLILIVTFVMGLVVTIAEPDLAGSGFLQRVEIS